MSSATRAGALHSSTLNVPAAPKWPTPVQGTPAGRTRAQAAGRHSLLIALPLVQRHIPLVQHILPVLHKPPLAVLLACL